MDSYKWAITCGTSVGSSFCTRSASGTIFPFSEILTKERELFGFPSCFLLLLITPVPDDTGSVDNDSWFYIVIEERVDFDGSIFSIMFCSVCTRQYGSCPAVNPLLFVAERLFKSFF